jgi:hypothetical protein
VALLRRIGAVLIFVEIAFAGATRINEVDFKNFDYPWDPPRLGVPSAWKWINGKPRSILRVRGGRHKFSLSDHLSGRYVGGYVGVESVTYGDINGDGRDEAAVDLIYSTGGTANWHYLYVFTLASASPTLIARLQSGSRADGGLVKVAIQSNMLILDFADSERRVGDCCSEGYIRVKYRWQSNRFVKVGNRVFGNLK